MAGDGGGGAAHAGKAGAAHAGMGSGGDAGSNEGGSTGIDSGGGEAGSADAGSGGEAGDASAETGLEIATPSIATGKTYVPFTGKISASGGTKYAWSIASGVLPAGLSLQGAQSATVTIAGTPTEAGQFPISFSVTDGSTTKSVDVTLGVTHTALFLSDRNITGVNELFIAEIGGGSATTPVRLNASVPSGGSVTSYAWSPNGSKVLYLAKQSSGGNAELWVSSLISPGTAQRVSDPGITVSQMAWLGAGNIAAYSTSVGDTYLVDLSGAAPSPSKLAIAGQGTPATVQPSPNGRSIMVVTPVANASANDVHLVTWGTSGPTNLPLLHSLPGGQASYSYDGKYSAISISSTVSWVDLSLPTPVAQGTPVAHGTSLSWSPKAEILLMETGAASFEISRLDFSSGSLVTTALASRSFSACQSVYVKPWSPDGRNGLFTCSADVRGIPDVATAAAASDFSLLPTGLLGASSPVYAVNWSPNSQWVALIAEGNLQLIRWSAPGVAYKPHANFTGSGVTMWAFSQNSESVALVGSIAPQNSAGLYLTKLPTTGAPPIAALVSSPDAVVQTDINWLPGSRVLTYRAAVSGATQLFALPVAADGTPGSPISISGVSGSGVTSYQLAPTR